MPAYRTPVRYKGSRCGLCSYCGCSRVRQLCAYPAWYIYSRWRRPRAPLGPPLRVLNISAPFRFALRYSVSFFYISSRPASCLASRSASRFASRLCVSSCVLFMRLAVASRSASRFHCLSWDTTTRLSYGRRFALLAACRLALRLVLGVCVSPCMPSVRVVPRFCPASRSALSLRSSRHAVSCSMPFLVSVLRFRSASCHCVPLFCLPVGCDFHEAPFRIARRSLYAVSNDPDETRREKRDEEARRGDGMKRRTRRGSRDEEQDERREARAEKVESSYAVSLGRLII